MLRGWIGGKGQDIHIFKDVPIPIFKDVPMPTGPAVGFFGKKRPQGNVLLTMTHCCQ